MSRSNPYVKKKRSADKTLLVFGEGSNEQIFLKHIKRLYALNTGVAVTVRCGAGGAADYVVSLASRVSSNFDKTIVVLDNDKSPKEMNQARANAKKLGIILIENTPCLEALLLTILNPGNSYAQKSSVWCKSEFHKTHMAEKNRGDVDEYLKFFPKSILDQERDNILALAEILNAIENK